MHSVHNKRKPTIYIFLVKTFVIWYKFFSVTSPKVIIQKRH